METKRIDFGSHKNAVSGINGQKIKMNHDVVLEGQIYSK